MKLIRIEVDETMLTDKPKKDEPGPWTGYLWCTKVFLMGGKKKGPYEQRREFLRVVEGETEDEYLQALAAVFDDSMYVLLEPQKEKAK